MYVLQIHGIPTTLAVLKLFSWRNYLNGSNAEDDKRLSEQRGKILMDLRLGIAMLSIIYSYWGRKPDISLELCPQIYTSLVCDRSPFYIVCDLLCIRCFYEIAYKTTCNLKTALLLLNYILKPFHHQTNYLVLGRDQYVSKSI